MVWLLLPGLLKEGFVKEMGHHATVTQALLAG